MRLSLDFKLRIILDVRKKYLRGRIWHEEMKWMRLTFEKYDKWIWRVNGTLLLLACAGAILVCAILGYELLKNVFQRRQVHDVVNVNEKTKKEEFLRLGYFNALKGTDLFLVPLSSEQKYDTAYYSKSAYSHARNYLVFNSKTKESYWIWESNEALILEDTKVHDQITDEKGQKVRGLVFEFVDKDANGDGVLNDSDRKSIHYFDLRAKKAFSIVDNVDRSIGVQQSLASEILIFYSMGGKSYFKVFDLTSLISRDQKEISAPK